MRYARFLLVPMLFVSLAFMNIGGCGGSGGGNGGGNNFNCQMPSLTTNFLDTGYFFSEQGTDVVIGVSSSGDEAAIVIFDLLQPDYDETLSFIADVVDDNTCEITEELILGILFDAEGTCLRQQSGGVFRVNDLISLGFNLGSIRSECEFIGDLSSADIETASREMLDIISNDLR